MSCLEKRNVNHRMGSMLHHRFPNGFTDLFMDETDREVSVLTDRAFRSLCVGDDAVYNDDFLYGYSPYSCLKPLVGEPLKKKHPKESKKEEQHNSDKSDAQSWKQQQQQNISHISSFLKVLSATEENCEGTLIRNGDVTDSKGESWDKSALRSIERELSEFSDCHTSLTDRHYKNHLPHRSGSASSNKKGQDINLSSGKSTKLKNGKSAVKLRKLNIKNLFLHSEFSPFQTWTGCNRYPFGKENTVSNILSTHKLPKWCDLTFYKELTEAHRKETLHTEEAQTCPKEKLELSDSKVPKPIPAPPPPNVKRKPSAPLAEKRCSSDVGDSHAAPWRRNKSRAKSEVPVNPVGIPFQESNSEAIDESILLVKEEIKSMEVKALEDTSSFASTPFSICQLMTPVIPSRQPTETSEVLQAILSPSVLELLGSPHSETKGTPEPLVKRETYKSLASSILFNVKDNRKRVKTRYSPPKFRTFEVPDDGTQSLQTDRANQALSEDSGSGISTPGILKDVLSVCSPPLEPKVPSHVELTKNDTDKPPSDYLLSNLLQTKWDAGGNITCEEEYGISPFLPSTKNKSLMAKKQNYPSLNLYKKASPVDSNNKCPQVPLSISTPVRNDPLMETKDREPSRNAPPTNTRFSPGSLNVVKKISPMISPYTHENGGQSPDGKGLSNFPDKTKRIVKDTKEKYLGVQPAPEENDPGGQTMNTLNVIKAARDAINAARNKARSASFPDSDNRQISNSEEMKKKETEEKVSKKGENSVTTKLPQNHASSVPLIGKNSNMNKEPPPVPKRNFAKSDIQRSLDKQQRCKDDKASSGDLINEKLDLPLKQNEPEPVPKQDRLKHVFSARQNNYIKHQRYTGTDDEQTKERKENNLNISTRKETDNKITPLEEMRDSEHIFNDLQALKELERVRLGDRMLEYAKSELEISNIDEEAKVKNDLISRELRNIKRGMLSMRGNTSAKRRIFATKEKEQNREEVFTKLDSRVIVNKALLNENYEKAKMALEEVISERERRMKTSTEQGSVLTFEENVKGSEIWQQEGNKDCITEVRVDQKNVTSTYNDLKDKLDDFRDENQVKQTQPRPDMTEKLGGRFGLAGKNMVSKELKAKSSHMRGSLANNPIQNSEFYFEGQRKSNEESGKCSVNEYVDKKFDAPPVPPRNKKGGPKRDGSTTEEKNTEGEVIGSKREILESPVEQYGQTRTGSEVEKALSNQSKTLSYKEGQCNTNDSKLKLNTVIDSKTCGSTLLSNILSENAVCLSPKRRENDTKAERFQIIMSPNESADSPKISKKKQKAHLNTDHLIGPDDNMTQSLKAETQDKINYENANVDTEAFCEIHRNIVSPLLLVNGISIAQSPPDQGSLSSKSSYFSVESALLRNTETESNVYHSLENLTLNVEGDNGPGQNVLSKELDKAVVEYYSLSDHEKGLEDIKHHIKTPQKKPEDVDSNDGENITTNEKVTHKENDLKVSPTNALSPTLEIPALFKIKDNIFNNKTKKPVVPWSPRGSLNISERVEKMLRPAKENQELPLVNETSANNSTATSSELFNPGENLSPLPSKSQSGNPNEPQFKGFLTVPQEEDRFSQVTPSSEGIESQTTSTADTAEEAAINSEVLVENERLKVHSKQSGSICSGSDSQTELPKPPVILPKSEKAVLKAIKLTNKRMKKEEAQKLSQRSRESNSKHRADKQKTEKSEQKTSTGTKMGRKSEKKHVEKNEDGSQHHESHLSHDKTQNELLPSYNENQCPNQAEMSLKTQRQSHDSVDCIKQSSDIHEGALERQGRSSDRHVRVRPEQRHYSNDRIISNVPVYQHQADERPMTDRSFHRSQSIDRFIVGKVEGKLSTDVSINEKLEPRTQRIEKSIMHELQQRGRARDKESQGKPLRRSHSIDAYHTKAPSVSRQSSIEHTIVTQSFPMTQRKLLQDPDSGQYFFVDLPVQVKTKTFFDPDTGNYVQLPVQPSDGALPQTPHMEVLTPPMVIYHSFVPVPLSPMTHNTTMQTSQIEPSNLEQKHRERARQMHCKEGHPYLEPAFGQQEHTLGEFMGTEELDCPS